MGDSKLTCEADGGSSAFLTIPPGGRVQNLLAGRRQKMGWSMPGRRSIPSTSLPLSHESRSATAATGAGRAASVTGSARPVGKRTSTTATSAERTETTRGTPAVSA